MERITISIHALREEGDSGHADNCRLVNTISIHALREEGDLHGIIFLLGNLNFYPRPP